MAHEVEGVQEPHDAPAPAITPLLPMAENSEIARHVFSLPHLGQAMGASASDIARKASKRISQSEHLYSYSGIVFASGLPRLISLARLLYSRLTSPSRPPARIRHPMSSSARPTSAKAVPPTLFYNRDCDIIIP